MRRLGNMSESTVTSAPAEVTSGAAESTSEGQDAGKDKLWLVHSAGTAGQPATGAHSWCF